MRKRNCGKTSVEDRLKDALFMALVQIALPRQAFTCMVDQRLAIAIGEDAWLASWTRQFLDTSIPGHGNPWTWQSLDMAIPGHGNPWTWHFLDRSLPGQVTSGVILKHV
jgi:hypothetical protein